MQPLLRLELQPMDLGVGDDTGQFTSIRCVCTLEYTSRRLHKQWSLRLLLWGKLLDQDTRKEKDTLFIFLYLLRCPMQVIPI